MTLITPNRFPGGHTLPSVTTLPLVVEGRVFRPAGVTESFTDTATGSETLDHGALPENRTLLSSIPKRCTNHCTRRAWYGMRESNPRLHGVNVVLSLSANPAYLVDPEGDDPSTSGLQGQRSPNVS